MLPGQVTRVAGQVAPHTPPTQNGVEAPQMRPQSPQLFGSADVSTHEVPHRDVPPGQPPIWQSPATHERPVPQAWPQAPQLALSVRVSAHAPLQLVSVVGQVAAHTPPAQTGVAAPQALVQLPQCAGSSSRLTLCCPQVAMPGGAPGESEPHAPSRRQLQASTIHVRIEPPGFPSIQSNSSADMVLV